MKRGPRLIRIFRAASLVSLASMIVASSVASCTFSRRDAVGATCRPNTVRRPRSYNRYSRWSQRGLWQRPVRRQITASGDVPDELSLDSSHVKAHRSAAGAKRGEWAQAVGRSRGGRTSKIHCLADDRGRPVAFALTPGNVADISVAVPLLGAVTSPKHLIADKAYDADSLRNWLKFRRIKAVIPIHRVAALFLTRSIAPSIDVVTSSSASSAVSKTGDVWQHDTTAWPETISPHSLSSRSLPSGSE